MPKPRAAVLLLAITEEGVRGAPDFVIEILSSSTAWRDQTQKRGLYEKHGVWEFWILNPESREFIAWNLANGKFSGASSF